MKKFFQFSDQQIKNMQRALIIFQFSFSLILIVNGGFCMFKNGVVEYSDMWTIAAGDSIFMAIYLAVASRRLFGIKYICLLWAVFLIAMMVLQSRDLSSDWQMNKEIYVFTGMLALVYIFYLVSFWRKNLIQKKT